ncbi:hypothetical protein LSTR_LSTR015616 [Laodelphax striatellus]|uniref:C2H2-type domain-containing protein n=1 Tax=Laodelphax striatellus TaxID=195883 RepID=A0A482WWI9_LAOST|nr:hypothetical protein LSTR_LSTR015616 [Laodelphax striatellus]
MEGRIKQKQMRDSLGRFLCPKCGKTYKYQSGLSQHINHECGMPPKFKCPFCAYVCKQKSSLKPHIAAKHHRLYVELGKD